MTREDIGCIIKWFSHIEQLATNGKTANGFQMPTDKLLATIKVVAKDSREYVEKFCNESIPKDLEEPVCEELEGAAENYYEQDCPYPGEARVVNNEHDVWLPSQAIKDAFIAGANWQKAQDDKMVDIIYQQGIEKGKDEMMETLKRKEKK